MGITMLPGWYDQIAPYVQQLSHIVPRLINPHLDAQRAFQARILENPQILQQFADIQANNPGAVDKLGFGKISGYLSQFPESQESRGKKEKDKAIASLTPEQQRERAANLAGVMSPQEMQLYGLNTKNLTLGIQEREQNLSEGEAKRREFERVSGLEKQFSEWSKGQGKFNLYAKRRSGEVPEWMADAVTSSSRISKQYDQDAQDYFRERELELSRARIALQKNSDRMGYEEWKRRSIQDQAERMAYRAGSTNIAGFATLIEHPELQAQLQKSTPEALQMLKQNPQMAAAIDAVTSQSQVNEKAKQGIYDDLRVAHQQAKIAADRLRNGLGTEMEVQTAVDSYNARLAGARGAGINAGILKFGVDPNATVNKTRLIPGVSKDERPRLMLVDPESGNVVKGDTSFEIPEVTKNPEFDKQIDMVFRDLVGKTPDQRKQVLEQMRSRQDPASQTAYKQVLEKLKRSGINTGGVQ